METLEKDKAGRGLGCSGGAGLPVFPGVRGQLGGVVEGNQKLERLGEAVLKTCGNREWHPLCLKTPALRRGPAKQETQNRNGPSPPAACARRPVSLSVTPRTLARQAPLSWLQMYPRLNILVLSEQKHAIT